MKTVKIPMTPTRALRLAKMCGALNTRAIVSILERGLKNLETGNDINSRKV